MAEPLLDRDELIQRIEAAFSQAYPGDDRFVDYSGNVDWDERDEIVAAFGGKHWKEIPLERLFYDPAALFFMTPEAYRYYLPAFLLACITHYEEAGDILGTVVFSLLPPTDPTDVKTCEQSRRRVEGITPAQRDALRAFLRFMKAHHSEADAQGDFDRALAAL